MVGVNSPDAFNLIAVLLCVMGGCLHQLMARRTPAIPFFKPDSITRKDTDPEPAENFYRARYWNSQRPAGLQQGLLFAGKYEFNWVVSVELVDHELEYRSIGNLITYRHVFTTCQPLIHLKDKKLKNDSVIRVYNEVKIRYGTPSLIGNYDPVPNTTQQRVSRDELPPVIPNYNGAAGVRDGRTILLHLNCKPLRLLYDYALIEMYKGIRPLTPLVGFMPVLEVQPRKGEKYGPDLSFIKNHRTPCYIASYGRPYYNFQGLKVNIVETYKIKFRVYYIDHFTCLSWLREVFNSGDFEEEGNAVLVDSRIHDKLWCFWPRKKVGAICDRDRGAPLVCNDTVYGIVVRGVNFDKCDTLNPFPVIVSGVFEYVEDLYYLLERGEEDPYKDVSRCSRLHLSLYLVVGSILFGLMSFND